jgi:hypothetical protein
MRHRSNAEHHTTRTSPLGAVDWPVTTAGKGTLRPSEPARTAGNHARWYDRIPRCNFTAQICSQRFAVSS